MIADPKRDPKFREFMRRVLEPVFNERQCDDEVREHKADKIAAYWLAIKRRRGL